MYGSRLVTGLVVVFTGIAVLFGSFGLVYNIGFLAVALLFGAVAFFMWYHVSGKFAERVYRSVERQARVDGSGGQRRRSGGQRRRRARRNGNGDDSRGGFGAGPREEQRRRAQAAAGGTAGGRARQRRGRGAGNRGVGPNAADGPSVAEAYRVLGLDRDADQDDVKRAYREKVKDVHPDSPSGDEERFKQVQAAYDRLADD